MATKQEITDALAALKADVAAESTVIASAEALLTGIAGQLANAAASATDLDAFKAEIAAMAASIESDTSGLSSAVAVGTPTPSTPPASPPATPGP